MNGKISIKKILRMGYLLGLVYELRPQKKPQPEVLLTSG